MSEKNRSSPPSSPPAPGSLNKFRLDDAIAMMKQALRAHRHAKLDWLTQTPGHAERIERILKEPPAFDMRYTDNNFQPFMKLRLGFQQAGLPTGTIDEAWRLYLQRMDEAAEVKYGPAPFAQNAKDFAAHQALVKERSDRIAVVEKGFARTLKVLGRNIKQYTLEGSDPHHQMGKSPYMLRQFENAKLNLLEKDYAPGVMKLACQILIKGKWKPGREGEQWEVEGHADSPVLDTKGELFGAMSQIVAAYHFAELGGMALTREDFTQLGPPQLYAPIVPPLTHTPDDPHTPSADHNVELAYSHELPIASPLLQHVSGRAFRDSDFEVHLTGEAPPATPAEPDPEKDIATREQAHPPAAKSDSHQHDPEKNIGTREQNAPAAEGPTSSPSLEMIRRPLSDRCIDHSVLQPLTPSWIDKSPDPEIRVKPGQRDRETKEGVKLGKTMEFVGSGERQTAQLTITNTTGASIKDIGAAIKRTWPEYLGAGSSRAK